MSDDLVKLLRSQSLGSVSFGVCHLAADRIEALERATEKRFKLFQDRNDRIEALELALKPFAGLSAWADTWYVPDADVTVPIFGVGSVADSSINIADLRRAASLLAETGRET